MNIKKLLNQNTWKGKEVGKAVLLTLIDLNKKEPNAKPLFSKEDIGKMVQGLANEYERSIYSQYVELNNAIINMSMLTEGYIQQAYHGYCKHLFTLAELHHTLDCQKKIEEYPVIMTEKQYQDYYAKIQKEKRETKASFKDIILGLLEQFTTDRKDKPKTPKPIKDALKALKKEPVTSEFILSRINAYFDLGYHQLPDGRRSDEISKEEYQQAVKEIILAQYNEETIETVGEQRALQSLRRAYKEDMDWEEESEREFWEDKEEDHSGITWHTYDTPPEGLTMWDIIAGDWNMTELYTENEDEYFREFVKDFPKLFIALKEELAKYPGLEKIAETKPANYLKKSITWGELADAGIWYYQDITTPSKLNLKGIAILKEDISSDTEIDENGYFIAPCQNLLKEKIMETDPPTLNKITEVLLLDGLRIILAYNEIINIFAEVYSVPELKYLKKDEEAFKSILEAFNNLTMIIYTSVKGSEKERQQQRERLKEIYPIIDLETLRPTEEAISQVKDKIANKGVTGTFSSGSQKNSIHDYILELAGINKRVN